MVAQGDSTRGLRIAYLCDFSPLDPSHYSGGNTRIHAALSEHAGEVEILPQSWGLAEPVRRLIHALPPAISMRLRWRAQLLLAPLIAPGMHRRLRAGGYDVLFCAYSYHSLLALRVPEGMVSVYTSDATPSVYKHSEIGESFGSYFRLSRLIDPLIEWTERRVYRKVDLLLWPSNWLRQGAEARYGLDPAKALRLPWGAGIPRPDVDPDPPRLTGEEPVRLLLVGRDWQAKGGPTTLAVLRVLRERGVEATLTIVGCNPAEAAGQPGVTIHPHLDKAVPDQMALFESLYRRSHFMVMPSFESYGFAFCEASAYGLPSLCLRVGGVPVRDGRNGHTFDVDARARDYADQICDYLADPAAYDALRQSSRREYEDHLNWDAWGRATAALLKKAVADRRNGRPVTAELSDPSPAA